MERVKNIEEVILSDAEVLMEMIETKRDSGLILPADESLVDRQSTAYGVIVAVGASIKDLEPGDIVLKTRNDKAPGYNYKGKELMLLSRFNIVVAVKKTNFNETAELSA